MTKLGGGGFTVRYIAFITERKGRGECTALKGPRQCPLVLLAKARESVGL